MPEIVVLCGDVPTTRRRRQHVLELDASPDAEPHRRVGLSLDAIMRRFTDNLPDVLSDMLELATYVYTADKLVGRGTEFMTDMGEDWRRKFRFKVAVRDPGLWSQQEVLTALVEALGGLSDDVFTFEFTQSHRRTGIEPYFNFGDPEAHVIKPDDVILFSGGIDSTAGVAQRLGEGRKVALVTHRSATLIAGRQNDLLSKLLVRASRRSLFHVPIWVKKGEEEPVEFSQRTRSFLFAVLGIVVARMFHKSKVLFFENGITSFNLPIAEHVLGTRASRTTHPSVLRAFERLFSFVLKMPVEIRNPFLWHTKDEVVTALARYGDDLISDTISCANVRQLPMSNKQCGVCFQCVERRFAVLAAELGELDPPDGYAFDLFRGTHTKIEDVTMAECHVLRAQRLATMSELAFQASYGQFFRALSSLPGSPTENARKIFELHQRYGRYVVRIVDEELKRSATLDEALTLPPTSLLAMINAPVGPQPAYSDPIEHEPTPSLQAAQDQRAVPDRRFLFAIDARGRRILFADGPVLKGVAYDLIAKLAEQFREDRQRGTPNAKFRHISTKQLLADFGVEEQTLRKRVHATRLSLEQQFLKSIDYLVDEQDVVQSDRWKGYRLNPNLLLVDAAELRRPAAAGEIENLTTFVKKVTTQRSGR